MIVITKIEESVLFISENLSRVGMTYGAGFLKVCVMMVVLMQSLDAEHAPRRHAAPVSCMPKELTALTKSLAEASLISFDEANGKHLGTWSPGFPELKVQQNSPVQGSKVQCSLLFMAQGLEKVLADQSKNLNPNDVSLHKKLRDTISSVNMLAACLKEILGGECSPKPSPPTMPTQAFERKQWSHTLLKTAMNYLNWLKLKLDIRFSKVKEKYMMTHKVTLATRKKYLEGSEYLL